MKKIYLITLLSILVTVAFAQSQAKKEKIIEDSKEAKKDFIEGNWQMKKHFSESYGYVIYPNVGKGGIGISGAQAMELHMNKERWLVWQNLVS